MKKYIFAFKISLLSLMIFITPGCGRQGGDLPPINGVKGPVFNVVDGQVLVTFKLLNLQVGNGFKAPIPKTIGSFVEFSPNMIDGGMLLQLHLDVEDLESINIGAGDGNYLPDGRPLPGIPGGKLENSLRIDTDWENISFYYHKTLFGVWIPVGFETAGISGFWGLKINEKRVGLLGLVGNDRDNDYKAGALLFLNLEAVKDKQLKKLIEISKRNPHQVY